MKNFNVLRNKAQGEGEDLPGEEATFWNELIDDFEGENSVEDVTNIKEGEGDTIQEQPETEEKTEKETNTEVQETEDTKVPEDTKTEETQEIVKPQEIQEVEQKQEEVKEQREEVKQETQEEYNKRVEEARTESVSMLEKHYSSMITEEQAQQLLESPEVVLPKLLAQVYLDTYESIAKGIYNTLPQTIADTVQVEKQKEGLVQSFYETWPQLDRAKHHELVTQTATLYGQLNKNFTTKELINNVGAQVIFQLGIDPTKEYQNKPKVEDKPKNSPFVPTATKQVAQTKGDEINVYTKMADEYIRDFD